jgi:hypothetical protein
MRRFDEAREMGWVAIGLISCLLLCGPPPTRKGADTRKIIAMRG